MAGGLNTFLQEMIKRKMIRKIPEGLANKFMTYKKSRFQIRTLNIRLRNVGVACRLNLNFLQISNLSIFKAFSDTATIVLLFIASTTFYGHSRSN